MEENKNNDELDVELLDDEEDIEDENDEDDEDGDEAIDEDTEESDEDDEEQETASEDEEAEAEASKETSQETSQSEEGVGEKEFAMKMLSEMGYTGTYEEAKAKYEAEHSGSETAPAQGDDGGTPDYQEMAKNMLNDINKEFGLDLKSFSEIDDLSTFAELAVNDKVGAIKAFRATNHRLIEEGAKKAAISNLPKAKRTVQPLPKSDGGDATVKGLTITKRELREYMEAFPELSREDAIKLIRRVKKQ